MDTTTILMIALGCLLVLILLFRINILFYNSKWKKRKRAAQQQAQERYLSGSIDVPVTSMDQFMEFDDVKR